ncbi:right-handed parallel beta-helix repeat-containing protein, partial [Candidatus Margulisiibacteriota bacterium]
SGGRNGIYLIGASGTGATIAYNTLDGCYEANIYINGYGGSITINNNVIRDVPYSALYSTHSGIRIASSSAPIDISNNTIVNNLHGITFATSGVLTIESNIISSASFLDRNPYEYDVPSTPSYGILKTSGTPATLTLDYNDVWNNVYDYSGAGVAAGANDISVFPRFVDPYNDDFDLHNDSPCLGIGAGGSNIGAYVGAGVPGSPYREVSYVSTSGTDDTAHGFGTGTDAYRMPTFANKYTVNKMNIANGAYYPTSGIFVPVTGKWFSGASRTGTVIQCSVGSPDDVFRIYSNTTIESLTVRRGGGTDYGINIRRSNNRIENCDIRSCGTFGVYMYGRFSGDTAGALITDCNFYQTNYHIYMSGSNNGPTTIEGCTFYSGYQNTISVINWQGDQPVHIRKNEIRDCGSDDAGIYISNSDNVWLDRNTIVDNYFGVEIAGAGSTATIENCVISSNPALGGAPITSSIGVNNVDGATLDVKYNNVWNNATDYFNQASGEGAVSQCPQFMSPTSDFDLRYNSPCIDQGDPATEPDPDGTRADMGAYPFFYTPASATIAVFVKEPNGGESLDAGTTFEVTWYASKEGAPLDHIEIYLSADGGSTYPYLIDDNEPNDGSYIWTVNGVDTTQAKIAVGAIGSGATDESDLVFEINADYYVDVDRPDNSGDGLSWGTAWKNITYACTQTAAGATIHVADGIYNAAAGESFIITIPATVELVSEASPTTTATIDAGAAGAYGIDVSNSAVLDGFTVRHSGDNTFAAVYLRSNATVRDCRISREVTSAAGVAIGTVLRGGKQ